MLERAQIQWLAGALAPQLAAVRRAWGCRPEAPLDPVVDRSCRLALHELFTFIYAPGHPANNYTRAGIPRTHNAWEMQLLIDGGLLFALYIDCLEIVEARGDDDDLRARVGELCARFDTSQPEALRRELAERYAAEIEGALQRRPPAVHPLVQTYLERVVIEAYIRLAMATPAAVLTFDLFPAHTGPENVREGLKGLVTVRLARASHDRARRFYCCRAESYTRCYGLNVAKELARAKSPGEQSAGAPLRFSLVVPHANGVRHITLTRCWPVDGAENAARYVALARRVWRERERELGPRSGELGPRVLVSGYSQGGAAVRIFDDAVRGVDVLARPYFAGGAPRGYAARCRELSRVAAGEWRSQPGPALYTLSVATMGGIDGRSLSEQSELPELAEDQRGASGVRARANPHGGLHLAICHDYDPARWILPAPLFNLDRRLRRRERRLSIVRILLKFGGPNLAFHGGTWSAGTRQIFRDNPRAQALLDDVQADLASPAFVDEHRYFDDRCERAAFPHLVVGTHGYPGWMVVEYFARALAELSDRAGEQAGEQAELLHEGSWRYDILPPDQRYEDIVAVAARFHERQRRRGLALLAELESGRRRSAIRDELIELLRRRFSEPGVRRHLLGPHVSVGPELLPSPSRGT